MRSKKNRRSGRSVRTSIEQYGEPLFKVVRKKHPSSAKSMVIIHTRIRPHSTSMSINGRKHGKDVDTFPSINDLLKKSTHSRQNSPALENNKSTDVNSQKRRKSEQSSVRTDRSFRTVGKHSLKSSKVLPVNEVNCNSSIQLNTSSKIKMLDDSKIECGSTDGLHDIIESTKKRKQKKFCCTLKPCAFFCLLGLLIAGLLLGLVLAILLVRFLPQSTTVKTNSPSSSSTTTTPVIASTTTTPVISSTTTTSTTTTVRYICNASCVNQSWTSNTNLLAEWEFDNNLIEDVSNTVSAADQSPVYVQGYANDALLFGANANQSITSPTITLGNLDFTIDAWIYPTGFPNLIDNSIVGICPTLSNNECLYLTLHQSSTGYAPYFGLLGDETPGNTDILLNQWVHLAFVLDAVSYMQSIYVNGVLDVNRTGSAPLKVNPDSATIGHIPFVDGISGRNYFQGIIDRVEITARVKSSCEILEEATLAAHFTFDSSLFLTDSGPNSLPVVRQSVSLVSSGRFNQAISFNGSSPSYYQIASVTNLGIMNRPFSISFWIRPRSLVGTLVHVSTNASGLGWCMPFLGFHANGSLVAQMYNGNARSIIGPAIPLAPTWTHIVETWAPVIGPRLYINNVLVPATVSMAASYTPNSASMYVTLGNSLSGTSTPCHTGLIGSSTPFSGDMDDFRIYSRALNVEDICNLYTL